MKALIASGMVSAGMLGLAACQTVPTAPSGFLSSYDGTSSQKGSLRASNVHRRDDAAARSIDRVYLERAVLVADAAPDLDAAEIATSVPPSRPCSLDSLISKHPEKRWPVPPSRLSRTR